MNSVDPKNMESLLKLMRMSDIQTEYLTMAQQAGSEQWPYEAYLYELLKLECEGRFQRKIERHIALSGLPAFKKLANFDKKRFPLPLRQQIDALLRGDFTDRQENVLIFGKPGTGKTHFASALGHELIQQGKKVLFTLCSALVQDLLQVKKEFQLPKKLKQLSRFDAIIIDEIGYIQQTRDEMEVLFTLLADRYERGSIIITSNLPFSKWGEIFKDDMLAAAAIDRLVHHSVILKMDVENYRIKDVAKTRKLKS